MIKCVTWWMTAGTARTNRIVPLCFPVNHPTSCMLHSSEKSNGVGKVQCSDYSHECSEDCGKEIVPGIVLKIVTWVIGTTAVILNVTKFISNIGILVNDRRFSTLINTSFGMLINVGDFLKLQLQGHIIRCLLQYTIVNIIVYGKGYCRQQFVWLPSHK